jgi:hypothetical protein
MIRENVVAALAATGKWSFDTARLAEQAGYKCEYCDFDLLASVEAYKMFEIDHIVPLTKGGSATAFTNLALSCRHCNYHAKRVWDPRSITGNGASREDLIRTVRRYIQGRMTPRIDLEIVRRIVGWKQKTA